MFVFYASVVPYVILRADFTANTLPACLWRQTMPRSNYGHRYFRSRTMRDRVSDIFVFVVYLFLVLYNSEQQ